MHGQQPDKCVIGELLETVKVPLYLDCVLLSLTIMETEQLCKYGLPGYKAILPVCRGCRLEIILSCDDLFYFFFLTFFWTKKVCQVHLVLIYVQNEWCHLTTVKKSIYLLMFRAK